MINVIKITTGILVILFTYFINKNSFQKNPSIKKEKSSKLESKEVNENVFYNIEYTGLDLSGNRYILKSKEAINSKISSELVDMKNVEAFFYFKDNTVLYIESKTGIYNNKTLDMIFKDKIKAKYNNSELYADKAEYANSKGFLTISKDVKVIDAKGTIFADKLLFDIKNQTLNITSVNNSKINANINLDEKRF